MAEFDELSVQVSADVADFQRGINRVTENLDEAQSEALQTGAAFGFLAGRADSAGDELGETATAAAGTSASLSTLSSSSSLASLSISSLATTLTASLAPALSVVAAAAIPVVTALGGFVAVAGAIGGIGLAGIITGIATANRRLKVAFDVMVQLLNDAFAPAFEAARDVLLDFIIAFEDIIPQLVPSQRAIDQLARNFRQLGFAVINVLPEFAQLAVTLATEFLPPFVDLAERVLPQLPGLVMQFVGTFRQLLPSFLQASQILARLAPELLEFGFAALNVVGPALSQLTQFLTTLLTRFNNLDSSLQAVGLQVAAIGPALLGIATLLGGPLTLAVGGIVAAFINFREEIIQFSQEWLEKFGPDLKELIQNLKPIAVGVFNAIAGAVAEVGPELGTLVGELVQFANVLLPIIQRFLPAFSTTLEGLGQIAGGVLQAITALVQALTGDFQQATQTFAEGATQITEGVVTVGQGQLQSLEQIAQIVPGGQQFQPAIGQAQAQTRGAQQAIQETRVVIEEDTENLEATVRETTVDTVELRERRANRLRNRGTGR